MQSEAKEASLHLSVWLPQRTNQICSV